MTDVRNGWLANDMAREMLWVSLFGTDTTTGEVFSWPFVMSDHLCMVMCIPLLKTYLRARYPKVWASRKYFKSGNVIEAVQSIPQMPLTDDDFKRFTTFFALKGVSKTSFLAVEAKTFWSLLDLIFVQGDVPITGPYVDKPTYQPSSVDLPGSPRLDDLGPDRLTWWMPVSKKILQDHAPTMKKFFRLALGFVGVAHLGFFGDPDANEPMHLVNGHLVQGEMLPWHACAAIYRAKACIVQDE